MISQSSKIPTNQKVEKGKPVSTEIQKEGITPERVYKSSEEWRKLGRQDEVEADVPPPPNQPQADNEAQTDSTE